jgi:predicted NodU family carbamoyl transferase
MNILDIHIGHDDSAALVIDGRIVADVAEERFTRTKHYCGPPIHALAYCLKSQKLTMADIDVVAVPAVVHADHTLRPQTVKQRFNLRFRKLINEFSKLTGEPLVLNASFNIMGEPIVNRRREAIQCLHDNGLDALVMDNFVLEKKG